MINRPSLTQISDKEWILNEDLQTTLGVKVPKGFVTDFFSIPRVCRFLVNDAQWDRRPAILHDWLYWTIGIGSMSRKECDDLFMLAMKRAGFGFVKRSVIYRSVRIGGWVAWNRRQKEIEKGIDISYPFPKSLRE